MKLPWIDLIISYGPGFNSTFPESFKLLVIITFKCCKFNATSNLTKLQEKIHHAYSFCLQHVLKNNFSTGASPLKKSLPYDDTAKLNHALKENWSIKRKIE